MYGYVYLTTNLITNKIYIGQKKSSTFLGTKYLGSGKYLKHAVAFYGKDNFNVELLDVAYCREELSEKESYYIDLYNSTDFNIGYNIAKGGFGGGDVWVTNGKEAHHIPDSLLESYLQMGWVRGRTPGRKESNKSETRSANISKALKGHVQSKEHASKHRQSLLNKHMHWYTDGVVCKLLQEGCQPAGWYRGRKYTAEQKKNCRAGYHPNGAWNKGLTKDTDSRVKKYSDSIRKTLASKKIK